MSSASIYGADLASQIKGPPSDGLARAWLILTEPCVTSPVASLHMYVYISMYVYKNMSIHVYIYIYTHIYIYIQCLLGLYPENGLGVNTISLMSPSSRGVVDLASMLKIDRRATVLHVRAVYMQS